MDLDRDGDDRRGGKGARRLARASASCCSDEIVAKIDYKNPQILRSFITDRGKMIPRRISGACARQQRVISTAIRRARMLALLPFSVTGDYVMAMQVILTQDVDNLGKAGELVSVKPGLRPQLPACPRGLAVSGHGHEQEPPRAREGADRAQASPRSARPPPRSRTASTA